MFYIWHTLLVSFFVATAFVLGYKLGQKKQSVAQKINRK
jgi:hypothetical protein